MLGGRTTRNANHGDNSNATLAYVGVGWGTVELWGRLCAQRAAAEAGYQARWITRGRANRSLRRWPRLGTALGFQPQTGQISTEAELIERHGLLHVNRVQLLLACLAKASTASTE